MNEEFTARPISKKDFNLSLREQAEMLKGGDRAIVDHDGKEVGHLNSFREQAISDYRKQNPVQPKEQVIPKYGVESKSLEERRRLEAEAELGINRKADAELNENIEEENAEYEDNRESVKNLNEVEYTKTSVKDNNFIRLDLPSHCVAYDFDHIMIRKLKIKDLSILYKGMFEQDFTTILDAIDATIDQPIRNLTVGDWQYIMYWQRIYSYPKSPMTINWTSKYGNKNKTYVTSTDLNITEIKLDKNQYLEFYEKGFDIPRVRDLEITNMKKLTKDQEFIFELAQFLAGNSLQDKINRLDSYEDLEIRDEIKEYAKLIDHGVKEELTVVDKNFNPEISLKHLEDNAKNIRQLIVEYANSNLDMMELNTKVEEIENEIEELKLCIKEHKPFDIKSEVVQINMDIFQFFPQD